MATAPLPTDASPAAPPAAAGLDALKLFGQVMDGRGVAMNLFDPQDRLVFWNRRYLELFPETADLVRVGLSYEAYLRRMLEANLSDEERAHIERHLAAGLARHRTQTEPYTRQRRDGRWLKVEAHRTDEGYLLNLWTELGGGEGGLQALPEIRHAVANLDVAFALFDADGRFVSANTAYAQTFPEGVDLNGPGVHYREHLRRHAERELDPAERPRLEPLINRAEARRMLIDRPMVFRRRRGGWLKLEERPTENNGLLSLWSDVSGQVEAESRVITLQDRLTDAIESLPDGFALYDKDGRLVICNGRYREIHHMSADLLEPGVHWLDFLRAGAERGQYLKAIGRVDDWLAERNRERQSEQATLEVPFADGRWYRISDRRTRDGGMVGIRADITDLKQRTFLLETLLENTVEGVSLYDPDKRLAAFNRRWTEILKVPPHLAQPGTPFASVVRHFVRRGDYGPGAVEPKVSEIVDRLGPEPRRGRRTLWDGTVVEARIERLADGRYMFTFADVTDRVRHEAELSRRAAMLGAVGYAATRLIGREDWETGVAELLRRLGEAAEVGRVAVFRVHEEFDGALTQSCPYDWAAEGLQPISRFLLGRSESLSGGGTELADWTRRRRRGDTVVAVTAELSGQARADFEALGIKSVLSVPIFVKGRWWGHILFADNRDDRAWTEIESDVLNTAGALIAETIERAQVDEELRKREERFRQMVEAVPMPILLLDYDSRRVVFANQHCYGVFRIPKGKAVGLRVRDYYVRDSDRVQALRQLDAMGNLDNYEVQLRRYDGTPFWALLSVRPVVHNDKPALLAGIIDISSLKDTEQSLRDSEALKSAVIDSALDCIVAIDEDGRIVEFNPAAEQTFGHREADVLGKPMRDLLIPPDARDLHEAGFRRYLETGRPRMLDRRVEMEAMRADGSVFPCELTITSVRQAGRRLFTAYIRDLTERRRADAEIARQREALHQRDKMSALGSLLASVAHELNNPLSVVVGQTLMLEEMAEGTGLAPRAAKIRNAADRCAKIVKSFLALARSKPPERAPVDLAAAIESAADIAGYGLRNAGVALDLRVDPDLPQIRADGDQLHQVLINLIVNAKQALQETDGPRRIELSARHDAEAGQVVLQVADSGPGIPDHLRQRIFEPFFTTKPVGVGTGIGLALTRRAVTDHQGEIAVRNREQGGAEFTVRLPVRLPADGAATTAADREAPPVAPCAVLVIDDERPLAETLADMLRRDGHSVEIAVTGSDGLRRLSRRAFDLVFCDIRMPVIDGPALYRELRARRPEMAERLVFVTGDTLAADLQGAEGGPDGVPTVEKPLEPASIRAVIAERLTRLREGPGG
jgi:PAS domain S-box-containing protein